MNEISNYPRVLIVGQSFDNLTGGGITMSNLFRGWPKDRLAVVSDVKFCPNAEICKRYYRFGADEYRYLWPFSRFMKHRRMSGEIVMDSKPTMPDLSSEMNERWRTHTGHTRKQGPLWNLFYTMDEFVGAEQIVRRLQLSPTLSTWVEQYNPDLIYTQAGCLHEMLLVERLVKFLQIPYVIHMMDDWPSTLYKHQLLSPYLRWRLNKEFMNLLDHSSGFLSISPKMSEVYQERYRRPCIAFHNPLELGAWLEVSKKDWQAGNPFRIMYRGRIGTSIQTSLIDISDAVFELFQEGKAIRFDITLSTTCDAKTKQRLERPGCVSVHPPLPYKDVPAALASADLLVISYDFDPDSINYIRYSMPTKAPEFMISGTPVLIYGARELAITAYAEKENWAYIVSERNNLSLKQAIIKLSEDQVLRERLACRAQELAILNHDAVRVRDAFRVALVSAINQPL